MTTTTDPTNDVDANTSEPRLRHIYSQDDGEIARSMGVQVQTWCGLWTWPRPEKGPEAVPGAEPNACAECERILRARRGDR